MSIVSNSSFLFNGSEIQFKDLHKKNGIRFRIDHSLLSKVNNIVGGVDTLEINLAGTFLRYERCHIRHIYENTNLPGVIEVVFSANTPIEICREMKLKSLGL
jgi:hypothetical protein